MAKILLIIRHAETHPLGIQGNDFSRALTEAGEGEAMAVGDYLRQAALLPDHILCSSAKRTRQTLQKMAMDAVATEYSDDLYLASVGDLLAQIESVSAACQRLMIIGHNPGLHWLVETLSGQKIERFKPASIAQFNLPITQWDALTAKGNYSFRLTPPNAS